MDTYFAEIVFAGKDNSSFWFPMFFESESEEEAKSFFAAICNSLREAKYAIESKREPKKTEPNAYRYSEILRSPFLEEKKGSFCKISVRDWQISKFPEEKHFDFSEDFLIKCIDIADKENLELPCAIENILPIYKIPAKLDKRGSEFIVINVCSQLKKGV